MSIADLKVRLADVPEINTLSMALAGGSDVSAEGRRQDHARAYRRRSRTGSSRKLPRLSWSPRRSRPVWGKRGRTELEADALRNRGEPQALLEVSVRLLAVLDATPQRCEMIGFMLRRSVATRTALHTVLFGARRD